MLNLTQVLYSVLYLIQVLAHVKNNAKYSIPLEIILCGMLKFNNSMTNSTLIRNALSVEKEEMMLQF